MLSDYCNNNDYDYFIQKNKVELNSMIWIWLWILLLIQLMHFDFSYFPLCFLEFRLLFDKHRLKLVPRNYSTKIGNTQPIYWLTTENYGCYIIVYKELDNKMN